MRLREHKIECPLSTHTILVRWASVPPHFHPIRQDHRSLAITILVPPLPGGASDNSGSDRGGGTGQSRWSGCCDRAQSSSHGLQQLPRGSERASHASLLRRISSWITRGGGLFVGWTRIGLSGLGVGNYLLQRHHHFLVVHPAHHHVPRPLDHQRLQAQIQKLAIPRDQPRIGSGQDTTISRCGEILTEITPVVLVGIVGEAELPAPWTQCRRLHVTGLQVSQSVIHHDSVHLRRQHSLGRVGVEQLRSGLVLLVPHAPVPVPEQVPRVRITPRRLFDQQRVWADVVALVQNPLEGTLQAHDLLVVAHRRATVRPLDGAGSYPALEHGVDRVALVLVSHGVLVPALSVAVREGLGHGDVRGHEDPLANLQAAAGVNRLLCPLALPGLEPVPQDPHHIPQPSPVKSNRPLLLRVAVSKPRVVVPVLGSQSQWEAAPARGKQVRDTSASHDASSTVFLEKPRVLHGKERGGLLGCDRVPHLFRRLAQGAEQVLRGEPVHDHPISRRLDLSL
mmetsp:Transcript_45483/g.120114  ORF Transcript_45483/g.120114 Transcript_45483/m.120114 type:complete len:509 (-) Transcript_45483:5-1531(-)